MLYDGRMIGHLEGIVRTLRTGGVLLSVGGISYKVALTRAHSASLSPEKPVSVWTYLAVREDALDLYGFENEEELHFFELLLTVPGVGPKSALAILDIATVETLRSAVSQGKAEYLTKVSGIGRKTAEKIVLELRDKVGTGTAEAGAALKGDAEALEAMRSLGYSLEEARGALRKVPDTFSKANDRLREALKILGSRE